MNPPDHLSVSQNLPAPPPGFWDRVNKNGAGGCWVWEGGKSSNGYGHVQVRRRTILVHRLVYHNLRGPIPTGLTLDHLCRKPACVNPDHLEPVTMGENMRRGTSPIAANARKTQCPRKHPLSGDNLRIYVGPHGPTRYCLICKKAASRRTYLRGKNNHV